MRQRGITLTELVIVMALAAMVMIGLVTFYLNSQNLWFDGSSQALVQRDGTLIIDAVTREVRHSVLATSTLDKPPNTILELTSPAGQLSRFYCAPSPSGPDSILYLYFRSGSGPPRRVVNSRIFQFLTEAPTNGNWVSVNLKLTKDVKQPVQMASTIALYSKGP